MSEPSTAAEAAKSGPNHIRRVILLWAILTVAGIAFALIVPTLVMPTVASTDASKISTTFIAFTLISAPVAALVWAVGAYSLLAWRSGRKDPPTDEGPPIRRNPKIEMSWVVISSILTLFLLIWGLVALQAVTVSAASDTLYVDVTGQQWVWSFSYPEQHVQSQLLELPVGRQVVFRVTSKDVVHGFWIPDFAIKVDANPAEITQTQTTPTVIGEYSVRCAELCGLYHAYMESIVRVVSPRAFASWIHANGGRPEGT